MKRTILNGIGLIAAGFALLVVAAAPASADQQLPFNTQIGGTIQITGVGPNGPTSAVYGGPGVGTVLGAAQMQGDLTITGPAACPAGFTATHNDTLTASNGDQLVVAVSETSCLRPASPNIYDCIGTYIITGGTGRLSAAMGSGTWSGVVTFGAGGSGTFSSSYSGLISLRDQP